MNRMLLASALCAALTSGLRAQTVYYFNDDFENGLNTTNTATPNYVNKRQSDSAIPSLTNSVSHSPSHSLVQAPSDNALQNMYAQVAWHGVPSTYDVWIRVKEGAGGTMHAWRWSVITKWSPGPGFKWTAGGFFEYYDYTNTTWIATDIPCVADTWYHLAVEAKAGLVDGLWNRCNYYISTRRSGFPEPSVPVGSIQYHEDNSIGWLSQLYFSTSNLGPSEMPSLWIDDIKVYQGALLTVPPQGTALVVR